MGISENDFLPQNDVFFQNIWNFLILVKTMIYPKHNLENYTLPQGIKDTIIPLRG